MAKGKAKTQTQEGAQAPAVKAQPVRRIAVVGCSDTKILAPYDDPTWEIWAMNNSFVHTKRASQWFEIHPIKQDEAGQYYRRELLKPGVFRWAKDFRGQPMKEYMQALANLDVPVWMQQHWDIIPKSEPYPLQKIINTFGSYFTNSVSYMIALAILQIKEGGTQGEIGLFGVDMATKTEYGPQRPSCEFFLGIAAGLGISITIPPEADLLKTRFLYGFGEREQLAWEAKMMNLVNSLEGRKQKAMQSLEMNTRMVNQYIGAGEALKEIQRIWSNLQDTKVWRDAG